MFMMHVCTNFTCLAQIDLLDLCSYQTKQNIYFMRLLFCFIFYRNIVEDVLPHTILRSHIKWCWYCSLLGNLHDCQVGNIDSRILKCAELK